MDIVLRQETAQEDNKLERRQQQQGNKINHKHQEYPQLSALEQYQNPKDLLRLLLESNYLQKLDLLTKIITEHISLDQRKLHENFLDHAESILAERVERFRSLYFKMNRTEEETEEMNSIKEDICNTNSIEKDKSYIIKHDDEPMRVDELQEKSREPQPNNNNNQQTLFKIQASNTNLNEKTKDNNDRQSLVIKLVKIAQQDDKNDYSKSERIDDAMEVVSSNNNLVEEDRYLETVNQTNLENNTIIELKNAVEVMDENPSDEQIELDQQHNEAESYLPVQLTEIGALQTNTDNSTGQSKSPEPVINHCSNSGQVDDEEHKSSEQEPEDTDNNDNVSVKNLNQQQDASPAMLGRNRRVRQKNRYFSDFHCMNLAKGTRFRDDCDANTSSSGLPTTRTSNRRSTTESVRNQAVGSASSANLDDEVPPEYELKRCRKCREKTPHDQLTGCQACVYKKIVEKHKGGQQAKSSSSRKSKPRTNNASQSSTQSSAQKRETDSTNITDNQTDGIQEDAPTSLKRKAINQTGGPMKLINHDDNDDKLQSIRGTDLPQKSGIVMCETDGSTSCSNGSSGDADDSNEGGHVGISYSESSRSAQEQNNFKEERKSPPVLQEKDQCIDRDTQSAQSVDDDGKAELINHRTSKATESSSSPNRSDCIKTINSAEGDFVENNNDSYNQDAQQRQDDQEQDFTSLDTWTPEQVANFVLLRGFASEAEQFKTQSIDGISLLLMQRNDFTSGLKMKLGPALKLYDQICKLKSQYYKEVATTS